MPHDLAVDAGGEVVEAFRVRTTEPSLSSRLADFPPSRVMLEVGTHSPWVSRVVKRAGHEAVVANPRRVRLIAENDSKSDGVDAELLARLVRVDVSLLKPIVHRGEQAQRDADGPVPRARDTARDHRSVVLAGLAFIGVLRLPERSDA